MYCTVQPQPGKRYRSPCGPGTPGKPVSQVQQFCVADTAAGTRSEPFNTTQTGGQFDFVWPSARTMHPHGAYRTCGAWPPDEIEKNTDTEQSTPHPPKKITPLSFWVGPALAPPPGTTLQGGNSNTATNLKACIGECDKDSQCAAGLKCFQRSYGEAIPGCNGQVNVAVILIVQVC